MIVGDQDTYTSRDGLCAFSRLLEIHRLDP
jgi:hypothetical protein